MLPPYLKHEVKNNHNSSKNPKKKHAHAKKTKQKRRSSLKPKKDPPASNSARNRGAFAALALAGATGATLVLTKTDEKKKNDDGKKVSEQVKKQEEEEKGKKQEEEEKIKQEQKEKERQNQKLEEIKKDPGKFFVVEKSLNIQEDVAAIDNAHQLAQCFPDHDKLSKLLTDPQYVLFTVKEISSGKIAGFACFIPGKSYIFAVCISTAWRGMGLASYLLNSLLYKHLTAYPKLTLFVDQDPIPGSDAKAPYVRIKMYSRHGFRILEWWKENIVLGFARSDDSSATSEEQADLLQHKIIDHMPKDTKFRTQLKDLHQYIVEHPWGGKGQIR